MEVLRKRELKTKTLPGRIITDVVGDNSPIPSEEMTVGFAKYCAEAGPMTPHHHAEESIYVMQSDRAWVLYGPEQDDLPNRVDLEAGMILHFPAGEWHVFRYEEGGSLEIIYLYGKSKDIPCVNNL